LVTYGNGTKEQSTHKIKIMQYDGVEIVFYIEDLKAKGHTFEILLGLDWLARNYCDARFSIIRNNRVM